MKHIILFSMLILFMSSCNVQIDDPFIEVYEISCREDGLVLYSLSFSTWSSTNHKFHIADTAGRYYVGGTIRYWGMNGKK